MSVRIERSIGKPKTNASNKSDTTHHLGEETDMTDRTIHSFNFGKSRASIRTYTPHAEIVFSSHHDMTQKMEIGQRKISEQLRYTNPVVASSEINSQVDRMEIQILKEQLGKETFTQVFIENSLVKPNEKQPPNTISSKEALQLLANAEEDNESPLSPKNLLAAHQFVLKLFKIFDEEMRKKRDKKKKRKLGYNDIDENSQYYQTGLLQSS